MVRYEQSWNRTRSNERMVWAAHLLDLLYVEPRTKDLSPGWSMGVIRFWSHDGRRARDVVLVRREYSAGEPTGRTQVLVPAPDEMYDPWGPWGSWHTAETDDEALAIICDELDNLPHRTVEPVVWTLRDDDGVVVRLVATEPDYPGLAGQMDPTHLFTRWSEHLTDKRRIDSVPGLTMHDHTGASVPAYRIIVFDDGGVSWRWDLAES
ncbi:hypothetical protein ACFWEJ_01245 [Promicromonospora sp. NPDC060204]|uniref:hypothetical protein n=1 Tax=Promicromonospora sp. NPDC060204 TaxID=3347071 RepID=UPI00364A85E5